MNTGICRLCGLEKELRESHFLPAALYKSLLQPAEENPHPYLMTPNKTIETSRQIKDFVLCADCEDRFNKGGEGWVLSHMAREGSFPLQESLFRATPIRSVPGLTTYAAGRIPDINVDKLEYFTLSVFWRAAVHDWKPIFGEQYQRLELGPYEENLRLYLLGGRFPDNVITIISVYEEKEFIRAMFPPSAGVPHANEGRPYSFLIPGIQFTMTVGREMTAATREFNSHLEPERRIFMSPLINERFWQLRSNLNAKQQLHRREGETS